ncbi:TonB-dependent receptor [candidate division KSB1 bacterium]|nr:TonB-dependent receptor [candidate division KSB1 bacterium]
MGFGQGGTHGKIVGRVIDAKTGDLLPSVNVDVSNKMLGASTNFKGEFFILGVPVGFYELRFTSIGYANVKVVDVQVSAGLETTVNIDLDPAPLELDKEIVVTAARNDVGTRTPSTIHIVAEDEIRRIFAETTGDVLMTLPGVWDDKIVRGSRASDLDFQIDGISIRDPLFGGFPHESFINTLILREIQVKTSGFSAEYGNAMSGIVNLITRDGGTRWDGELRIKNSLSSMNGSNGGDKLNPRGERIVEFTAGGPLKFYNQNVELFISGKFNTQRNRTPGLDVQDPEKNNITDYPHNRLAQFSFFGKAVYNLNPNMKIVVGGLLGRSNVEEDSWLWRYNGSYRNLPSVTRNNNFGYVRLTHTFSNRLFYEATIEYLDSFFNRGLDDESITGALFAFADSRDNPGEELPVIIGVANPYGVQDLFVESGKLNSSWSTNNRSFGASIKLTNQLRDFLQLKTGLEIKFYQTENSYRGNSYEIPTNLQNNYKYSPIGVSGFVISKVNLSKLSLDTGLRVQRFDSKARVASIESSEIRIEPVYTKLILSPRLGLSYDLRNGIVIHANKSWNYQLPTFNSLYAQQETSFLEPSSRVSGNPNLSFQRTVSNEAGLTYSFSRVFTVGATGYYKKFDNIENVNTLNGPLFDFLYYDDTGSGHVAGMEFNFIRRLNKNFAVRFSYNLSSARGTFADVIHQSTVNEIPETLNDFNEIASPQSQLVSSTPQKTIPLSSDRRHVFRATLDYSIPNGIGPKIFGMEPFQNLTANFTSFIESGTPYTPLNSGGIPIGEVNSLRNPWRILTNIRLQKTYPGDRYGFSVFLDIRNVFNRVEPLSVFPRTSNAIFPGQLFTTLTSQTGDDLDTDADQVNQYNEIADFNNDGIVDDDEKRTAYNRFLQDFRRLKLLHQLPREVWFGILLHF